MAPSTGVQALPTIEETNLVHPALEMHYEALPGPPTDLRNLATLDTAALASGGDRNIESNFYQYLSLPYVSRPHFAAHPVTTATAGANATATSTMLLLMLKQVLIHTTIKLRKADVAP